MILLFPKGLHPFSPAIKWHQVLLAWSSFLVVLLHFSRGKGGRASTMSITSVCCTLHFLPLVCGDCLPVSWNHSRLCNSSSPAAFHTLVGGRRRLFLCAWFSYETGKDNIRRVTVTADQRSSMFSLPCKRNWIWVLLGPCVAHQLQNNVKKLRFVARGRNSTEGEDLSIEVGVRKAIIYSEGSWAGTS